MRLVDADEILRYMEDKEISQYLYEVNEGNDKYSSTPLYDYVKAMPTAYDIDKIVEELKKNASRYTKKYVTPYGNNGYKDTKAISINKAIEIVKQGGAYDDVCEWKYNNSEYYWESSCKHLHIFMSDGPEENEYKHCPYCGKKIKIVGD